MLEFLGIGTGILDEVLDEMGRAVLPALTTTTTKVIHDAGVVEDVTLAERDLTAKENQGEPRASSLTMPRLLLHLRIECPQPEPVEDYGFYIVRAATRNRIQNKVKIQFRDGIWDGQALFGRKGSSSSIPRLTVLTFTLVDTANLARTVSSSTAAEPGQVISATEGKGSLGP